MLLKGKWSTKEIWLDGEWLDPAPSQKVCYHSPDGFNWGYRVPGPAQLALALALKNYGFKYYILPSIAALPQRDFEIEIII